MSNLTLNYLNPARITMVEPTAVAPTPAVTTSPTIAEKYTQQLELNAKLRNLLNLYTTNHLFTTLSELCNKTDFLAQLEVLDRLLSLLSDRFKHNLKMASTLDGLTRLIKVYRSSDKLDKFCNLAGLLRRLIDYDDEFKFLETCSKTVIEQMQSTGVFNNMPLMDGNNIIPNSNPPLQDEITDSSKENKKRKQPDNDIVNTSTSANSNFSDNLPDSISDESKIPIVHMSKKAREDLLITTMARINERKSKDAKVEVEVEVESSTRIKRSELVISQEYSRMKLVSIDDLGYYFQLFNAPCSSIICVRHCHQDVNIDKLNVETKRDVNSGELNYFFCLPKDILLNWSSDNCYRFILVFDDVKTNDVKTSMKDYAPPFIHLDPPKLQIEIGRLQHNIKHGNNTEKWRPTEFKSNNFIHMTLGSCADMREYICFQRVHLNRHIEDLKTRGISYKTKEWAVSCLNHFKKYIHSL